MRIYGVTRSRGRIFGFALFAVFMSGLGWLTQPSAATTTPFTRTSSRSNEIASPSPRPSPTPCNTCGSEGPQTIYAPLIELPDSSGTEINLNCRSSHIMNVTPTFYTRRGEPLVGRTFQMQPAEVKTVDLMTLMPASIRHRQDLGGMSLSYTGGTLEMWGQLRLMNINHGSSVDVTFSIDQDKRSEVRNAVWNMPEQSETIIAIGNFSNSVASATLEFSNGNTEQVQVPPFGTQLIRKQSKQLGPGSAAGVTVKADGSTNLIATGLVTTNDGDFTSSIRFYDTENVAQPNLYATNFRLKNVKPQMMLRNTGAQTISAVPRVIPAPGDPDCFIDLPSVTLGPYEIVPVDVVPLQAAVSGRSEFDRVSIQILNTGPRGSLIGALNGRDEITGMTYDVPLRDIGGLRNSTGAYPWRLDHDLSTIVSITNVSTTYSEIVVQINYAGGSYILDPRKLKAGETATYDLREIRDRQIPDRNGHTIPVSVTGGQFKWFIQGGGSGRVIGRAEMLGQAEGISSSYSCPGGNCPPMLSIAFLDPSDFLFVPEDEVIVQALEIDCDAFTCYPPFAPNVSRWDVVDPSLSIVLYNNGSQADVFGVEGGTAVFNPVIGYETYAWDGQQCIDGGLNFTNPEGQAHVLSITSISPARGVVSATTHVTITGTNFASGATVVDGSGITASNATVNSGTSISADLTVDANASGGNHSIKVKVGSKTSKGKDFYVQIPSKLLPFNHTLAPNGIGPLHTPNNQPLLTIDGQAYPAPFDHICGVFRHYLFYLADQDNPAQEITTRPFTVDEIFTNYSGSFSAPSFTPVVNGPGTEPADLQSLFFFGTQCLQPGDTQAFDMKFKITFGGHDYFPTTTIHISRGNFAGTLKLDRTITTP